MQWEQHSMAPMYSMGLGDLDLRNRLTGFRNVHVHILATMETSLLEERAKCDAAVSREIALKAALAKETSERKKAVAAQERLKSDLTAALARQIALEAEPADEHSQRADLARFESLADTEGLITAPSKTGQNGARESPPVQAATAAAAGDAVEPRDAGVTASAESALAAAVAKHATLQADLARERSERAELAARLADVEGQLSASRAREGAAAAERTLAVRGPSPAAAAAAAAAADQARELARGRAAMRRADEAEARLLTLLADLLRLASTEDGVIAEEELRAVMERGGRPARDGRASMGAVEGGAR
jgi:hypothetical protein